MMEQESDQEKAQKAAEEAVKAMTELSARAKEASLLKHLIAHFSVKVSIRKLVHDLTWGRGIVRVFRPIVSLKDETCEFVVL